MSLLTEIKRRKVFKVAAVYAAVAWLLIQIVTSVDEDLSLPDWFAAFVIVLLGVGFPVAIILAWVFDVTPDRLQTTPETKRGEAAVAAPPFTVVIQILVLLAVGFLVVDQYFLDSSEQNEAIAGPLESITQTQPQTFMISLPENVRFVANEIFEGGVAISPDGRYLVFTGTDSASDESRLFLQTVGQLTATPMQGTEGGNSVSWAPDSRTLLFYARNQLWSYSLDDRLAVRIAGNAYATLGASMREDGAVIARLDARGPIYLISADRTDRIAVTAPESNPAWPQFLGDGEHFLYLAGRTLTVGSVSTDQSWPLLDGVSTYSLVPPNRVVYSTGDGALRGFSFDPESFERTETTPNVIVTGAVPPVSASRTGDLVYRTIPWSPEPMIWVEPDGTFIESFLEPGFYTDPDISPDGKLVAYSRRESPDLPWHLWVTELETGHATELTSNPEWSDRGATWSPDSEALIYQSRRPEGSGLYQIAMTDREARLLQEGIRIYPYQWTEAGFLYYFASDGPLEIFMLPSDQPDMPSLLVTSNARAGDGAVSRSGNWLIYTESATGRYELYVKEFPVTSNRGFQITDDGAVDAMWGLGDRLLYYLRPSTGALMSMRVIEGSPVRFDNPQLVHPGPFFMSDIHSFAIHPLDERILLAPSMEASGDLMIHKGWLPTDTGE